MDFRQTAAVLILAVSSARAADELHFYATPVRVYAGDAVTLHYLGEKGVARERIASWQWDFDGDGKVDARGNGYSGIDATWYATYDATDAERLDDNGFYHVSPTLTVTTTDGLTLVQDGLTEDHYGVDPGVKAEIIVRPYNARNAEISVDFSGGPRLASLDVPTGTAAIRLYPDVELKQTARIVGYRWSFGDGEFEDVAKQNVGYASHLYRSVGTYTVSLEVRYVLDVDKTATNSLAETKEAYVDIQPDKGEQYQLGQECAVVCPPPWKQMVRKCRSDAADKSAGSGAKPTRHCRAERIGRVGLRESSGQHEQDNKKNAANDPEEAGDHADDAHQGWLFTGVGYACKKQIDEERA